MTVTKLKFCKKTTVNVTWVRFEVLDYQVERSSEGVQLTFVLRFLYLQVDCCNDFRLQLGNVTEALETLSVISYPLVLWFLQ